MKILVIDNGRQISPLLLIAEPDVEFYTDEILALNAVERHKPELILLSHSVRGGGTAEYIDLLLEACSTSSLVVIGDDLGDEAVLECLAAGAKGYLNNRDLELYLGKMIHAIKLGEAWISRRMTAYLLDFIRQHPSVQQNQANVNVLAVADSLSKLQ